MFSLLFFLELLELSAALWHFMQDNQVIADGFTMTQNYIIKDISAEASKLCPVVASSEGPLVGAEEGGLEVRSTSMLRDPERGSRN